jgi:hypothetical protein
MASLLYRNLRYVLRLYEAFSFACHDLSIFLESSSRKNGVLQTGMVFLDLLDLARDQFGYKGISIHSFKALIALICKSEVGL